MIYCNLKGGLGNMLFQMASTISISIDNCTDFSFPNLKEHLDFLDKDDIHNPYMSNALDYEMIFYKFNTYKPKSNIKKINYPFNYQYISLPNEDIIIDGFFQSEKYFKHNRESLLEYFRIPDFIKNEIKSKYNNLTSKRITSVHVRRGDYLKFPNHHPTQSLDYYKTSIDILKNDTDIFLIFSDDIEWCKLNIIGDNIIYIENEKDYIEMYLMSLCDNNIISNSSFSWWGAWLNKNKNKIVIGTKLWFGNEIQLNTDDIIPDDWIKL